MIRMIRMIRMNIINRTALLLLLHLLIFCALPFFALRFQPTDQSLANQVTTTLLIINFLPAILFDFLCGSCRVFTDSFIGMPTDTGIMFCLASWSLIYLAASTVFSRRTKRKADVTRHAK